MLCHTQHKHNFCVTLVSDAVPLAALGVKQVSLRFWPVIYTLLFVPLIKSEHYNSNIFLSILDIVPSHKMFWNHMEWHITFKKWILQDGLVLHDPPQATEKPYSRVDETTACGPDVACNFVYMVYGQMRPVISKWLAGEHKDSSLFCTCILWADNICEEREGKHGHKMSTVKMSHHLSFTLF